ncbi:hypothetical protein MUK42_34968 [Musa troglodytarum]|uniref:Uncharacterized protein n=1 Tax=Musa troglodytarum TaxID=320322 RepID=A0A9E7G8P3_9LILI|nr:hypothetical protein MUK42_34968 [Musa troglodytarum]
MLSQSALRTFTLSTLICPDLLSYSSWLGTGLCFVQHHTIAEEMEEMQSFNKETVLRDLTDESEEPGEEFYNDSNSISEGYDTTVTLDLDDEAEKLDQATNNKKGKKFNNVIQDSK